MLQDIEEIHMQMCETAYSTVQNHWEEIKELGFYGTHLPENYLNMVFLFLSINRLGKCCVDAYHKSKQWKDYDSEKCNFFDFESARIMGQVLPVDEPLSDYEIKALEWRFRNCRIETVSGNIFTVYDCFDHVLLVVPPLVEEVQGGHRHEGDADAIIGTIAYNIICSIYTILKGD